MELVCADFLAGRTEESTAEEILILIYRRLMKGVLERDGWRCRKCGPLENLQVHQKIKRSKQGDDALANLVTLCAYRHMAEHGQLFYTVPAVRICSRPKLRKM